MRPPETPRCREMLAALAPVLLLLLPEAVALNKALTLKPPIGYSDRGSYCCNPGELAQAPWHPTLPPGPHNCMKGCNWNGSCCELRSEHSHLLWEDEFEGFNHSTWRPRGPYIWDCGTDPSSCMDPRALSVEGGELRIQTAYHSPPVYLPPPLNRTVSYTSGSVDTSGRVSFGPFGRWEVSAKVAAAGGLNSALWLMPATEGQVCPWPKCGEIDIMEQLSRNHTVGHGTYHWAPKNATTPRAAHMSYGCQYNSPTDLSDNFHV